MSAIDFNAFCSEMRPYGWDWGSATCDTNVSPCEWEVALWNDDGTKTWRGTDLGDVLDLIRAEHVNP